jgi:hypothetical protein
MEMKGTAKTMEIKIMEMTMMIMEGTEKKE